VKASSNPAPASINTDAGTPDPIPAVLERAGTAALRVGVGEDGGAIPSAVVVPVPVVRKSPRRCR
jgi:hypothetical protein